MMRIFKCSIAQKGFYAGPVYCIRTALPLKERIISEPEKELKRLEEAMQELKIRIGQSRVSGRNEQIRETVLSILSDEAFSGRIRQHILEQHTDASTAVRKSGEELSGELGKADSEYIRSRGEDIRGTAEKLIAVLEGCTDGPEECSAVCAGEISPAQLSSINEELIGGMLTEKGSPNSHASILAGNIGIPYLYGSSDAVCAAEKAAFIILDGENGAVTLDPEEDLRKLAEERMEQIRKERAAAQQEEEIPVCRTRVCANIEGPQDIEAVLASGADGIGLFRTEFLFLGSSSIPTEEEQYEAYRKVLEGMEGREVIIRTMDIGSDKKVPWLELPKESNPALGMRGARVSLERSALFRTQIRALLRAAVAGNLKVMFPMIASAWEIDEIIVRIKGAAEELEKEGVPYKMPELGIMVETPAAALTAEELAEKVSFFSIGTNDLTQYTLALDREAQGLERYFQPHHDAIFRLIRMTAESGHRHGTVTGVCGQLAADPEAVERLIRAGVDELSVSVRKVKATRKLASEAEKKIAARPEEEPKQTSSNTPSSVAAADGELFPMAEIPDPVFSGGSMGECLGILPENGNIYAPVSGTVSNIAETGHAITIAADDGWNLLIHVGIDTVSLGGKPFHLFVKEGEHVTADQLLMEADLELIKKAGLSPMVILVALKS